jgi:predicted small secreted protein
MNQKLLPLLVLTVSGLLCGCDQPVSQGAGSTVQSAKLKIGFVARRSNGYWSLVRFGFDTAAVT